MLSDSPPNRDMEWSDSGVEGSWRFLNKVWKFVTHLPKNINKVELPNNLSENNKELLRIMNTSINDVTKAIDEFHFNIAVASVRSLYNSISSFQISNEDDVAVVFYTTKNLLILMNPMVPHLAEELWRILGNDNIIANEKWPQAEKSYIEINNVKIPVQVNGKVRAVIEVPKDTNKQNLEEIALNEKNVSKFLKHNPKKVIIIPNRIVNFVI